MSNWLLSHVPGWLILLGLIVVIAGGAILVQLLVRHRFPQLKRDAHNDVLKFAYGVIGFVYAFFIGFVVSSMWGQTNDADAKVRSEGAAGVQLARDLTVFEKADSDRIRQSLLDYEVAVQAEWPIAANGRFLPEADKSLARLYTAYEAVQPRTDAQKTLLATSFSNLNNISQTRTERVLEARVNVGPPWSLWAVIFLTSGLVLGCAIIYGVESPAMHYPMVAVVGILVATNLYLVLELAHPFIGEVATSPAPLGEVITVLSTPQG